MLQSKNGVHACPDGHFCHQDSIKPIKCPPGHVAVQPGQSSCAQCSAGYMCPSSTSMRPCLPGSYQDSIGQGNCSICASGLAAPTSGLASCIGCPIGSMCPDAKEISECPMGSFQDRVYDV